MVKFIKEIILKYLLVISKCTKLPIKKETNKQNDRTQNKYICLHYSTYLHVRNTPDIYFLLESLKLMMCFDENISTVIGDKALLHFSPTVASCGVQIWRTLEKKLSTW